MSLSPSFLEEIEALKREVQASKPNDTLQFCANHFAKRLEQERTKFLQGYHEKPDTLDNSMTGEVTTERAISNSTFPGRLSINPFDPEPPSKEIEEPCQCSIDKVTEDDEQKKIPDSSSQPSKTNPTNNEFLQPIPLKVNPSGDFPENYGMGRRTSVSAESLNPTASSKNNWTPPFHQKTPEQIERLKKSITGNFLFSHLDDELFSLVLGALVEKQIPIKNIKVFSNPALALSLFIPSRYVG